MTSLRQSADNVVLFYKHCTERLKMAEKKRSNSYKHLEDSISIAGQSRNPFKFVVKPIDWSDLGLTEEDVHSLLDEDEEDSHQRPISVHMKNGSENKWKRHIGRIDWNDIGMTEEKVMQLIYDGDDLCDAKNSYNEALPIKASIQRDVRSPTFRLESSKCSEVTNDNEKDALIPLSGDYKASKGKVFNEDFSTQCQFQTVSMANDIPQEIDITLKNECLTEKEKMVCYSTNKNRKVSRKIKAVDSATVTNAPISKTESENKDIISKGAYNRYECKYGHRSKKISSKNLETVENKIRITKGYSSLAEEIDTSTNPYPKTRANSRNYTETDSLSISKTKTTKGSKGVTSNSLKRKFQETIHQENCFDGVSCRKTRRLEKIEEPECMKKPSRKCVSLSLGTKDTTPLNKLGPPKPKRRRWRF